MNELEVLTRRFNREREARKQAEFILDLKSQELLQANEEFARHSATLEARVRERTMELTSAQKRLQLELQTKATVSAELDCVKSQLVETSRAAGMTEIVNGVLHNVSNVLNSVHTSADVSINRVSDFRIPLLKKVVDVLLQKQSEMGERWTEYDKIEHLPQVLNEVFQQLSRNQQEALDELRELREKVDLVAQIVQSQQAYAKHGGFSQRIKPSEIFDTAVNLVTLKTASENIRIDRNYEANDAVEMDKSRVLQILTNFIKNALEATHNDPKHLVLSIVKLDGYGIAFSVRDFGKGFSPDTCKQLFRFGFTTKQDGHGFGLHSAACSAREMKGKVYATSDGEGQGACFTLEVPIGVPQQEVASSGHPVL